MRKVYIITCTMQSSKECESTLSNIECVVTSEKMAHKQLDEYARRIEQGKWWSDENGNPKNGKVIMDTVPDKKYQGIIRDMLVEVTKGVLFVFRIVKKELNQGLY